MQVFMLLAGIALLLWLIIRLKFNAFIALVLVSLFVGTGVGMHPDALLNAIQKGMGDTLGSLAMIVGLGVMLGRMLTETGAVEQISTGMIRFFGIRHIKLALVATGTLVGIAMFYNAGFMVLLPLVFSVAARTGLPLVYVGIATASALSVTHGFLPPHPGPVSIAGMFKANLGRVLVYGLVLAVPAIVLAGLVLPEFLKNIKSEPPANLFDSRPPSQTRLPSFPLSLFIALIPVLLMALGTTAELMFEKKNTFSDLFHFAGNPGIALLIALLIAIFALRQDRSLKDIMHNLADSVTGIALMLLIIGAGGAFKQVLIDSGVGNVIADSLKNTALSPLLLGWLIATFIRIALGSATVAGITAAGIVQPLVASGGVNPELMVLAIGAGSLMCSHVNDTGFWMFKEYFGLTVPQTFRSWTVMETLVGTVGLAGVLLLDVFV